MKKYILIICMMILILTGCKNKDDNEPIQNLPEVNENDKVNDDNKENCENNEEKPIVDEKPSTNNKKTLICTRTLEYDIFDIVETHTILFVDDKEESGKIIKEYNFISKYWNMLNIMKDTLLEEHKDYEKEGYKIEGKTKSKSVEIILTYNAKDLEDNDSNYTFARKKEKLINLQFTCK